MNFVFKMIAIELGFVSPEKLWWGVGVEHSELLLDATKSPWRLDWQLRPVNASNARWLDSRLMAWCKDPLAGRFRAMVMFVDVGDVRPPVACRAVSGLARCLKKVGQLEDLADVATEIAPMLKYVQIDSEWYEKHWHRVHVMFPGLKITDNLLSYLKEVEDVAVGR